MVLSANSVKTWLQVRTQEQRLLLLVSALIVCAGIWYFLWESGYQKRDIAMTAQILSFQQKISVINEQNREMQKILGDPNMMRKQQQLAEQLKILDIQIVAVSKQLVTAAQMSEALKSMWRENPGLTLLRLENTANVLIKTPEKALKKLPRPLYRHDFVVEFKGNYMQTLSYLMRLEKLPWRFYWDGINYDVTQYPEARTKIQLHTVSSEQGLINDA